MAVTRIKNNQITDATITASKIASQTLVGSLFANDLTLNSNVSIVGNLTITGSSSNINAINTFITDPFVIFNNGYSGSLANYTIGILVNRNLASLADYGSVNTAWVWDENDGAFAGLTTTDTGVGITTINNSGYANVKVGNLVATHSVTATNYNISQANVIDAKVTTLVATNFSTGNAVISGGYIQSVANVFAGDATITTLNVTTGNVTTLGADTTTSAVLNSTTGNITTLTSTTVNAGTTTSAVLNSTTGNITTVDAGTTTSAVLNSTTGNVTTLTSTTINAGTTTSAVLNSTTGNITTLDAGTTTSAVLNSTTGNITTLDAGTTTSAILNVTTGNITTLTSTTVNAGTATSAVLNATTGNITDAKSTTLVATNFSSGNAQITGGYADNFPIGANTKATGAFTTLTSDGSTTFTNSTESDTASSGAVVVTGGLGVGANLNVAGNLTVTGNLLVLGNTTTLNVETLNVEDLNITVAANATSGAEANGGGLTVAGANATFTYLNADDSWNLNKKLNATTVGAAIINVTTANITTLDAGTTTSATLNSTAGNITTLTSSTVNAGTTTSTTLNSTTGNITTLDASTTTSTTLNATTSNITDAKSTTLVATNFSSGNAVVTGGSLNATPIGASTASSAKFTTVETSGTLISSGNIVAASGVNATNFTTGALVVSNGGGAGITGELWVQGASAFQGNIVAGNIILSGNINVPVGGTFSNTGVFFGNAAGIGALYAGTTTYTALPHVVLQITGNLDTYTQVNFQNYNSGTEASTDYVATADNGTDFYGYINIGINSSTFADPHYEGFSPNDGYVVAHGAPGVGGNLLLNSELPGTAIKLMIGGYDSANVKAAVTNTGFRVNTATASTTSTSGALIVDGGAGIGGNLNVGYGAIFNASKTADYDFIVRGDNDDTLIWARPSSTYDAVVIGNSATTGTLVTGAKLIVNTTDSIMIPSGTTAQRPGSAGGTDTAGMIRFNTSNAQLEYYDGAAWQNTGTDFTVIASETFDGDDGTTIFTLAAAATTQSVIVSINGVIQIPTLAYSVSGTTLTFTSAPATGDKIEVRRLSTTATVSTLESSNGYVSLTTNNNFANINAGTSAATTRMSFDTAGNVAITANMAPSANVSYDLGNVNNWYKNIFVNSTVTGGADLAENYLADAVYTPGTVVEFGGLEEITVSMTEGSVRIAGVITSNPAHVMNGGLKGSTVASVALLGRVPVNVIGPVYKGDMLISAGYGYARACSSPTIGSVIGKALANFEGEKGSVEVVVGRL
jgi:hypothetical protein